MYATSYRLKREEEAYEESIFHKIFYTHGDSIIGTQFDIATVNAAISKLGLKKSKGPEGICAENYKLADEMNVTNSTELTTYKTNLKRHILCIL